MSNAANPLDGHLLAETTTVCFAWIVTREDGTVLGFTDHDRELLVGAVLCEPQTGFLASEMEASLGLNSDTNEVAGALSSSKISTIDIDARLYDGARVTQWLVNWSKPEECVVLRHYRIGEIVREDGAFRVELRSQSALLDQPRGRYYSKSCDADLGDQRCGVDLQNSQFRAIGHVVNVEKISLQSFASHGMAEFAANWFSDGILVWVSGELQGQRYAIAEVDQQIDSSEATVSLVQNMLGRPAVGDSFELLAGCDKSFQTCKTKFSNGLSFRGFPHMPRQ